MYMYIVIRMGFSSEATFYVSPCEEGAVCAAVDLEPRFLCDKDAVWGSLAE